MSEELVVRDASAFMPALDIEQAVNRFRTLVRFVESVMREGIDYGTIPGTGKPTLYKPGAEKLCTLFGLTCRFRLLKSIEDWTGEQFDGEPLFYYLYRCQLHRGDLLVAEADGSCNSRESKYRWRYADRVCPFCDQATIIKGKEDYGGGWLCWRKKGGCGAKFAEGDLVIEDQVVGRILNEDIASQVNTIQKMAQKRSLVAATLIAVNASEFFTQDIEDLTGMDGEDVENGNDPSKTHDLSKWDRPDWSEHFFDEALAVEEGYYTDREHVIRTLKEQGFSSLKRDKADALLQILRELAVARQEEGRDTDAVPL